MLDEKAKSKSH